VEEREGRHETYMATQAHSALTRTWFYETHVDSQWPSHSESSPRQGALEAYRLVLYIVVALNRALRLRKSSEFQRVRQQGRSITSRLLILAWVPNEVGRLRIGFVVSKRISKLAVKLIASYDYSVKRYGAISLSYPPDGILCLVRGITLQQLIYLRLKWKLSIYCIGRDFSDPKQNKQTYKYKGIRAVK